MNLQKLPKAKRGYLIVTSVEKTEEDNKTASGIYIPDVSSEQSLFARAKVVSVGSSREGYKTEVVEGDTILINKKVLDTSDKTFNLNGVPHYIIDEEQHSYAIL